MNNRKIHNSLNSSVDQILEGVRQNDNTQLKKKIKFYIFQVANSIMAQIQMFRKSKVLSLRIGQFDLGDH